MRGPQRKCIEMSHSGQIAIFIALIFQILFVLFVMVINVGLLVSHKINLQNSADLGAYYAGMKQAEMLNAIAHINYQIRQSWKLFNFRYRHLGGAGDEYNNPWKWSSDPKEYRFPDQPDDPVKYFPSFCINYPPVIPFVKDTLCKSSFGMKIPKLGTPDWVTTNPLVDYLFGPLQAITRTNTAIGNQKITADCNLRSVINFYTLARFIFAYKVDMANRKQLLIHLANAMSKSSGDFTDLSGDSVLEGVKATIQNNLTPQNRDSFQSIGGKDSPAELRFFNSLGAGECGSSSQSNDQYDPPPWLREIFIYPILFYAEGQCQGEDQVSFSPHPINLGVKNALPAHFNTPEAREFVGAIQSIYSYIGEPQGSTGVERLYKTTLGFEKNPWCLAYVGVSVKTEPSIPFHPFGGIALKATAFAKPFGGRVGPWDKVSWSSSSWAGSDGDKRMDVAANERIQPGGGFTYNPNDPTDTTVQPDYSRFTGDTIGTKANATTAEYTRAIHEKVEKIDLHIWDHLVDQDKNSFDREDTWGDALAWNSVDNKTVPMRNLEISVIAPDQFDITHYSIDPDFYHNYIFGNLEIREKKKLYKGHIRLDLGGRQKSEDKELETFGVRDQINVLTGMKGAKMFDDAKVPYFVKGFGELLTSWHLKAPGDFALDSGRFGKCPDKMELKPREVKGQVGSSGSCVSGGRTGYSVKLVNGQFFLQQDLELGGDEMGSLHNPWSSADL